ncbi:ABC transporter substrate-binding protein [Algihabitans albus]|uniref:ABC transporter substrate-binding protein n=1 Tax=Algihabitans albus TaxID=2164067 RepID=UPI000E5CEFF8|nr:ABC transporter substrate-binding protein [Algihabitans albus]
MRKTLLAAALCATLGSAPAAAQNGELMLYTSQPQDLLVQMIEVFNETHPEIEVSFFRSGTTEVMNKLEAEFAAGDPQPDVLLVANSLVMTGLKNDGRLLPYPEAPTEAYDSAIMDPDGAFVGTKLITTGIVYNTELVSEPPTSWADLTDARFENQVIMPSPLYSGAAALHVGTMTAHESFGWDYYEALADNGAIAGRGNGSVLEAVATGQNAVGIIVEFMAFNAKAEGSPVDFAFPSEGVTAITEPAAILSTAENPVAAEIFIDWLLSEAGQRFSAEQGYLPALPGAPTPSTFPDEVELEIIAVEPGTLIANDEEMKKSFANLFGG